MVEIRLRLNDQLCSAYVDLLMEKKSNKVHRQELSHFVHYEVLKAFPIHKIMYKNRLCNISIILSFFIFRV